MSDVKSADRNMDHLYPPFAEKLKATLAQATHETKGKHGADHWVLVEGLRTQARQNWLYAQGRPGEPGYHPGDIVTHIRVSNHSSALAGDCYPVDAHGNIMWEAHESLWAQFGHCVRANGLQWGGDFPKIHPGSTFVDEPHVEPNSAVQADWGPKAKAWLKEHGL